MRVNYIEDNKLHQKTFLEKFKEYPPLKKIKLNIIPAGELDFIYDKIDSAMFGAIDIFVVDIHLGKEYTGIDLAKKIRLFYPHCNILFLSNDSTKGMDIINNQIFPEGYLIKKDFEKAFFLIEKIMKKRKGKNDSLLSLIKLPGIVEDIFISPLEINYISTINGERSALIIYSNNECFIIQDKMKNVKIKFEKYSFFNKLKSFSINPYNIKKIDKKKLIVVFNNNDFIMLSYTSIKSLSDYMNQIFYNK